MKIKAFITHYLYIQAILLILCSLAAANPTKTLLQTKYPSFGESAATFHLSGGDATEIQKVSLTFFTSNNCSSDPFIPAFTTPDSSPSFTIPASGNVSLNAQSLYGAAINGTPGTTNGLRSVLIVFTNLNGTAANFTGSTCASNNGNCCLPISCNTVAQTCSSNLQTQNFALNSTAPDNLITTTSPLLIRPSTTGSLLITNNGTTTINNISAILPTSLSDVSQNSSNCNSLAAGSTCQLSFTASSTLHAPTLIAIHGDNTNTVFTTLAVAIPWIPNNIVNAMVRDPIHQIIYIGGNFTQVGPNTGSGVPINSTGDTATTFPQVTGTIKTVISDRNGGWYIGGTFSNVGGLTRNNLAHVKSDGTVNPNWNPNVSSTVNALALSPNGTTVYAGGTFTSVNSGTARNRLAAFENATGTNTGTVITSWNPSVSTSGSSVNAMILNSTGSILYIGGTFTMVSGASRTRLAAINTSDGSLANWSPQVTTTSSAVNTLAISPDNSIIYVGGTFTTVTSSGSSSGFTRSRLAAFDNSGVLLSWNPNITTSTTINSIALNSDGTIVYVGGDLTRINTSITRNRLAAFENAADSKTGTVLPWNPSAASTVNTVVLSTDGNTVYTGGQFTSVNTTTPGITTTRNRLAAFENAANSQTGAVKSWDPNAGSGVVNALAVSSNGTNDTIYAGGTFVLLGGKTRLNLAALNESNGSLNLNWDPSTTSGTSVYALALSPDNTIVYAGGSFTSVNTTAPNTSTTRNRIAAFENATGSHTGVVNSTWNPDIGTGTQIVQTIQLNTTGSIVYVGGNFSSVNNTSPTTRNRLAAFEDATGSHTGAVNSTWNPNISGTVYSIALSSDDTIVYIGGSFTTVNGGTTRNNIAAFEDATGSHVGMVNPTWNPNIGSNVNTVFIVIPSRDNSFIYAGGAFSSVNGGTAARTNIAAFQNATGTNSGTVITNWTPTCNSTVRALAISPDDNIVYAGGAFTTVNTNIARGAFAAFYNPASTTPGVVTSLNPNATGGTILSLLVNGGTIYSGGSYTAITNTPASYFSVITQ